LPSWVSHFFHNGLLGGCTLSLQLGCLGLDFSFHQGVKVVLKCNHVELKLGTQKSSTREHHDTKFGCNTINGHKLINDYSRKITPICFHAYRINHLWQEAENQRLLSNLKPFAI